MPLVRRVTLDQTSRGPFYTSEGIRLSPETAFSYFQKTPRYSLVPDGKSFATSTFRARGDIWLVEAFRQPHGLWHAFFR